MKGTRAVVGAGVVTVAAGLGLIGYGISADGRLSPIEALALGILAVVVSTVVLGAGIMLAEVRKTGRTESAAYDLGSEMGYDRGWQEGRRSERPVVVPMPNRVEGVG